MTIYAAQPKAYPEMPDYRDHRQTLLISGYDREPDRPNPEDSAESFRPVALVWTIPDNGIYATMPTAVNGHRGNRVYRIATPGATQTYMVQVNGLFIPVEFNTIRDAQRFAQHIEDMNTED